MSAYSRAPLLALLVSGCFAPVGNGATSGDSSSDSITGDPVPTTGAETCVWKQRSTTLQPSARVEHSLVYDSDRDEVILFGGRVGDSDMNDLWRFSGNAWVQSGKVSPPPPVRSHAAAYDAARKVMVVFGGAAGAQDTLTITGDTWLFKPQDDSWEEPATVAPSPRYAAAMAFYAGNVVLFGGNTSPSATDDEHWNWNGSTWAQAMPSVRPSQRARHMLAVGPAGDLVLYGGCTTGNLCLLGMEDSPELNDSWRWDGSEWTSLGGEMGKGQFGAMALHLTQEQLYRFSATTAYTWVDGAWIDNGLASPPTVPGFAVAFHSGGLVWIGGVDADPVTWVLECSP